MAEQRRVSQSMAYALRSLGETGAGGLLGLTLVLQMMIVIVVVALSDIVS